MKKNQILFITISLFCSFFSACKINVESQTSGNAEKKDILLNLTNRDLYFAFTEMLDQDFYNGTLDLTDYFDTLPRKGDELTISLNLKSTTDAEKVFGRYVYYSDTGTVLGTKGIFCEDVRSGREFTAQFTQKISESSFSGLAIRLYIAKNDYHGATVFESGTGVPSSQPHIQVQPGDTGIDMTIRTLFGESFKKDGGGKIEVLGRPIAIKHTNDNIDDGKTQYTYPFVEEGECYYIKFTTDTTKSGYIEEWVKCTAGEGISLDSIINTENFLASTVNARFNSGENKFYAGLETHMGLSDIVAPDYVTKYELGFAVVLGAKGYWSELYNGPSDWWGGEQFDPISLSGQTKFRLLTGGNLPMQWKSGPSRYEWEAHNNMYSISASVILSFVEYPDQEWEVGAIWSDLKYK